ncbi:MAG: carboxypeptidase regulatory-like domain-containing protein [Ruminiclostridium sp.]|nr:carboxypeptidase regulatory-like domain-containing protein [Ruminiclostridium sp.]
MDWFTSPSRRLVMRLSIIVQVTDDLTGLPVSGSNARVWIEGQKPAIVKQDGRYVFVDVPEGEYVLNASGGIYTQTAVKCKVTEGAAENVTLRLMPNRLYPLPADHVRIEGKAAPGAVLRMYSADRSAAFKLLSGAKKGSRVVGIYHSEGINIQGKLLKIIEPDGGSEYIRVVAAEEGDMSEYQLADKLKAAYPKIGTVVLPVTECAADSNGDFTVMLKTGSGSSTEMICEVSRGDTVTEKRIDISGSEYIKADFTE